jgi:hypothetical protein
LRPLADLVVSAEPNMLRSTRTNVPSASIPSVGRRSVTGPRTRKRLKGGHRRLLDFLRGRDGILGDRGRLEFLVERDAASCWSEGHLHRSGQAIDSRRIAWRKASPFVICFAIVCSV